MFFDFDMRFMGPCRLSGDLELRLPKEGLYLWLAISER